MEVIFTQGKANCIGFEAGRFQSCCGKTKKEKERKKIVVARVGERRGREGSAAVVNSNTEKKSCIENNSRYIYKFHRMEVYWKYYF
jgi:hypothetical protein